MPIWSLDEADDLELLPRLLHGLRDSFLVERLQQVVDGVDFKSLHRILVERGGKDDLRHRHFAVEQLLDHPKAVESRHLHIEEDEVGRQFLNQVDGLDAVLALRDHIDVDFFQQVGEFVACQLFVIDNDCRNRHSCSRKRVDRSEYKPPCGRLEQSHNATMQWAAAPVVHWYSMVVIFGIHAVSEALKSGARSFDYVGIARERHDQRVQRLIDDCRTSGVQVRFLPREELDRAANTNTHQGVIAVTSSKQYADVDTLLEQRHGEHSFLVVLDGIEDPHNLGALIRTADGAGADGVVIPERRAVGLTGTVVKASAGASEHLRDRSRD